MRHSYHTTISFPLALLRCMLRMQQLVLQREITALQHQQAAWRLAKDRQAPAPTDLLEHATSMQAWVQQSQAFFSERWLFPDEVWDQCCALIVALAYGGEQLNVLLAQLRSVPVSASIRARKPRQALLAQLGTVEQAYDTIAERQKALDEYIGTLEAPDETPTEKWVSSPPVAETGVLEQLAAQVSNNLATLGLSSLPVSIHPTEQQVRVNDLDLIIRPTCAGVEPSSPFNVPGWKSSPSYSWHGEARAAPGLAWELVTYADEQCADWANEISCCTMRARSTREAAIEASLWFLRRALWKRCHVQLLPARSDGKLAIDEEEMLSEETVSVHHLIVVCQPEQWNSVLERLQRLLNEHQAHASLVDVSDSAIRSETTLHFFSDDPLSPVVEEWLKKADGVIDYGLSQPFFHLIIEDEEAVS